MRNRLSLFVFESSRRFALRRSATQNFDCLAISLQWRCPWYIRYPLSLRQVEDILFERGIDICHETVRYWWNRFGPMFAAAIKKRHLHHRSGVQ